PRPAPRRVHGAGGGGAGGARREAGRPRHAGHVEAGDRRPARRRWGPAAAPGAGAVTAKILIVEDSPSMRSLVRETLDRDGYEVTESADGRHALGLLEGMVPDLIITDINMPHLDGLALLREVRRLPSLR